ncbi:MAG: hypothetical protein KAR38_00530 [Calditrichia bacterium]|nr:hypothetical protein [Calditrichia bacterium]
MNDIFNDIKKYSVSKFYSFLIKWLIVFSTFNIIAIIIFLIIDNNFLFKFNLYIFLHTGLIFLLIVIHYAFSEFYNRDDEYIKTMYPKAWKSIRPLGGFIQGFNTLNSTIPANVFESDIRLMKIKIQNKCRIYIVVWAFFLLLLNQLVFSILI